MGRKTISIDVKKNVILLRDIGMSQHKICRQLKISRRCIHQTIRKFDRYDTVATCTGTRRPKKTTNRQTRLIKLEQIRDETNSLTDLVRYANTNMSPSISTSTISRILRQYNMISYIASRKPRITLKQRRAQIDWCNEHLSWSVPDWSKVIFSDERNYEVLNRKNRISFRRFRIGRTRSERSQKRTHRGGGLSMCTTHHCALEARKWSIHECFVEIGYEFFCEDEEGVYNFGNPCNLSTKLYIMVNGKHSILPKTIFKKLSLGCWFSLPRIRN